MALYQGTHHFAEYSVFTSPFIQTPKTSLDGDALNLCDGAFDMPIKLMQSVQLMPRTI